MQVLGCDVFQKAVVTGDWQVECGFFVDKLSKNCLLLGYGSFLYALFICKDFLDMLIFESQRNQGFPKFTGYMV